MKSAFALLAALAAIFLSGETTLTSPPAPQSGNPPHSVVTITVSQPLGDINGDGKPFSKITVDGVEIGLDTVDWNLSADCKTLTIEDLNIPQDKIVTVKVEYPGGTAPTATNWAFSG